LPVAVLTDPSLPLIIAEGEFKALALWRLANCLTTSPRFMPVSVGGVYNWRGTIGKTEGANGERRDVKGVIPDIERIAWKDRRVVIAYDADAEKNPTVRAARSQLARALIERGAQVGCLEWPIKEGKGIDDRLANVGPDKVLADIAAIEFGGWQTRLLRNDKGKLLSCYENVALFLQNSPEWVGVLDHRRGGQRVGRPLRHRIRPLARTPRVDGETGLGTAGGGYHCSQQLLPPGTRLSRISTRLGRKTAH
jgi:hypothetical protein